MVLEPRSVGMLLPILHRAQFHFQNQPTKPRDTIWAEKFLHQAMVVEGPNNFMWQEYMVMDIAFSPPMCILVNLARDSSSS